MAHTFDNTNREDGNGRLGDILYSDMYTLGGLRPEERLESRNVGKVYNWSKWAGKVESLHRKKEKK